MGTPLEASILTVGKFEAIHLGHRALIGEVKSRAKAAGIPSVVIAFEPHPFRFLRDPHYAPIFTKHERAELLRELDIDYTITYDFNAEFAALSAQDFCREIFENYRPREIIVGENYRFGKNREGTAETFRESGMNVIVIEQKTSGAPPPNPRDPLKRVEPNFGMETISTSRIRELLGAGDMQGAAELLGFQFFVSGEVTRGRQIGRVLGFPTLNLYPPPDKFLPENGVYETVTTINGIAMNGLTNIGLRPTVSDETQISVETHIPALISKPDEMYGKHIKVQFTRFLRPERRFDSAEELSEQIKKDLGALPQTPQGDKPP